MSKPKKNKYKKYNIKLPEYRFWSKVDLDFVTGCWNWVGRIDRLGYGQFFYNKKLSSSHRFSYETFKNPIPKNLVIDHLCHNRKCCNPNHLEAVTQQEKILDEEILV